MTLADVWITLAAPLTEPFMLRALWVGALVGTVCAVLSCFIVLKGWSLMGDAVSHAVLPGIALAYALSLPLSLGAFATGLLCVLLSGWLTGVTRLKPDTVMGVVFTGLFGLGLVLVERIRAEVHLKHILFGNLLGIESGDLWQVVAAAVLALAILTLKGRDLRLVCFDPAHARVIGLPAGGLGVLLLATLAMTIVASIQAVGVILVVAMLITPGAIGVMMADSFGRMLGWAVGSALAASLIGTYASYFADSATGACIVLALTLLFSVAAIFGPRHGVLARRRAVRITSPATP